ncbi:MAG: DUF1761 domain-containing protein [Bacteroidota bacterium]
MKPAILLASTMIPMVMGFIWYNEKTFGKIWMNETGMTKEKAKEANMIKTFGFTVLFSLMVSITLYQIVIHQSALQSLVMGDQTSETQAWLKAALSKYGNNFRTFKHGMMHGFMTGLFLVLPVVGVGSQFEMKSWKYIFITAGYWIVSMMVMGGIICQWG